MPSAPAVPHALRDVARLFLRLGATAFGGPAAHIALMELEVVRRRGWLTRDEFLDLLGATNLIPGPNSTELAIHVGFRRAGWAGLLAAGACFILPAMTLVWALAWAYVAYGSRPELAGILYGVKPVIIAVVLQALWLLGRSAVKTRVLAVAGALAAAAGALGVHELTVLFATAAATTLVHLASRGRGDAAAALAAPLLPLAAAAKAAATPFALPTLFLVFLKIGAVLFGSGYVLLAFLRSELVVRLGWLTESQLLDAVAVGQVTPGPVFTTATFVGYLLGGHAGAALATLGIFLPAFCFVALSGPLVPRIRRSAAAGAFLDGLNVASLALMAVVTGPLARSAIVDVPTALLALLSAVALLGTRLNSGWLVLAAALVGLAVRS
jgi:chromate transporter